MEENPLVNTLLLVRNPKVEHPVERQRWYILAVMSYLSAQQCLFWFTFSSQPQRWCPRNCVTFVTHPHNIAGRTSSLRSVDSYYGINNMKQTQKFANLLLQWGTICFIPGVFLVSWSAQYSVESEKERGLTIPTTIHHAYGAPDHSHKTKFQTHKGCLRKQRASGGMHKWQLSSASCALCYVQSLQCIGS